MADFVTNIIIKLPPIWDDFMFSIRFHRCLRLRLRRKDFYLSLQNCLHYTLDMWDKESIGNGLCHGNW